MDSIIFNWENFVVCNFWPIKILITSFNTCHFMNFILIFSVCTTLIPLYILLYLIRRYVKWITIWLALYLFFWYLSETTKWYSLEWIERYILLVTLSFIDFLLSYWKEETFLVYSPLACVIPGNRTEGTTETTIFKLINDKQGAGILDTNKVKHFGRKSIVRGSQN